MHFLGLATLGLRNPDSPVMESSAVSVDPFGDWLRVVSPTWQWNVRHLVHVREKLALVTSGACRKLALFLPPRHGKSMMTTVRYPVWRLETDHAFRACVGCYNQTFAERFGRQARRIAARRFALSGERAAAREWETPEGGVYRSCGVGSPPMGEGFDLVIIDDATKSREEADSEAYRERVWEWYAEDLTTRLEPGAAIILIMTRWHDNDLAGRILASEDAPNWTVVNLPAEAEEADPLGRVPGEALWPQRYDLAALAERRLILQNSYYALFQGRPRAREGGLFKRSWFADCFVDTAPAECQRVRAWDKAGSTKKRSDYSTGVLMARDKAGLFYVEDVVRGRWTPTERNAVIRQTAEFDVQYVNSLLADQRRQGYGVQNLGLEIHVEQEPGAAGIESAEISMKELAGYAAYAAPVSSTAGNKEVRAQPFSSACGAGLVRLVRGTWVSAWVNELCSFPGGIHDDQVDASALAYSKLALKPKPQPPGIPKIYGQ